MQIPFYVVDGDRYLWVVSKYIENNPVRAAMVKRPNDYLYSSARAHVLGMKDPLLKEPLFDKRELNDAVNRRGKSIKCRVTCTPIVGASKERHGTILMMEEQE